MRGMATWKSSMRSIRMALRRDKETRSGGDKESEKKLKDFTPCLRVSRSPCLGPKARSSGLLLERHLVEAVDDLVLVLQQQVDPRLVVHRLVDRFRSRSTIGFEEDVEVDVLFEDRRVEPDRDD